MRSSKFHAFILSLAASALLGSAFAMDTPKPEPKEPEKKGELDGVRGAIARQDWAGAQVLAKQAVERNPQSADAHNLYAYSMRKGASPAFELVFRHYNEALRLDPRHRGAHEYIGEAYLMTGNLVKAREHLGQLDRICTLGCEEYTKLKQAVASFEQSHAKK